MGKHLSKFRILLMITIFTYRQSKIQKAPKSRAVHLLQKTPQLHKQWAHFHALFRLAQIFTIKQTQKQAYHRRHLCNFKHVKTKPLSVSLFMFYFCSTATICSVFIAVYTQSKVWFRDPTPLCYVTFKKQPY